MDLWVEGLQESSRTEVIQLAVIPCSMLAPTNPFRMNIVCDVLDVVDVDLGSE